MAWLAVALALILAPACLSDTCLEGGAETALLEAGPRLPLHLPELPALPAMPTTHSSGPGPAHQTLLEAALPGPGSALVPDRGGPGAGPEPTAPAPAPAPAPEHRHAGGPSRTPGPTVHAHAAPHAAPALEARRVEPAPVAAAGGLAIGLALLALYHHLTKERVLEHPARRRLLELLDAEGALSTAEAARALEVSYRTARHHLEILLAFDLARAHPERGVLRWSRPGCRPAPSLTPGEERVLAHLETEEGLHLSGLARALGLAKATVKLHVDHLVAHGLVEDDRVGPLRVFRLARPQAGERKEEGAGHGGDPRPGGVSDAG